MSDFFEIREISPSDKIPLQVGLQMLSPESIRQRFFANKKGFSEKELQFLTEVDQVNHLAYVAVHRKGPNGEEQLPASVIRAIKNNEEQHKAEIGITIVDCYQGHGLGTKLLTTIGERASKVGISCFYGDYHTSNNKMSKLLHKFADENAGLKTHHTGDGFIYFEVQLKPVKP